MTSKKEIVSFTYSLFCLFDWYQGAGTGRLIRYPTILSKGAEELDDRVLKAISNFMEQHARVLVIFNVSTLSMMNLLSPRVGAESLHIFASHNDGILLEGQREVAKLMECIASHVVVLESLEHLFPPKSAEDSQRTYPPAQLFTHSVHR